MIPAFNLKIYSRLFWRGWSIVRERYLSSMPSAQIWFRWVYWESENSIMLMCTLETHLLLQKGSAWIVFTGIIDLTVLSFPKVSAIVTMTASSLHAIPFSWFDLLNSALAAFPANRPGRLKPSDVYASPLSSYGLLNCYMVKCVMTDTQVRSLKMPTSYGMKWIAGFSGNFYPFPTGSRHF